jgi:hypothetical protein
VVDIALVGDRKTYLLNLNPVHFSIGHYYRISVDELPVFDLTEDARSILYFVDNCVTKVDIAASVSCRDFLLNLLSFCSGDLHGNHASAKIELSDSSCRLGFIKSAVKIVITWLALMV